jgi:MerR family transcriptional regulator, copper efflux regulator
MRISELAARSGTSNHALRHYEKLGLIKAGRSAGGYREFSESVVREVTFIVMGRRIGFSLKEIAEWLPAYRSGRLTTEQMIEALQERIAQIDMQIAQQRVQRGQLVEHIAWFRKRAQKERAATESPPATPWPSTRKTPR